MALQIAQDHHADEVLTDQPVRPARGDAARPAVPDGARVRRPGEDPRPLRHARARRGRRRRPRGVRRAVRGAAGGPPLPGLDGGAGPGARRATSSRSTTATPPGSGTRPASGQELLRRLQALPGFGKQKSQIFVALLGKQLGVRPEGWEQAAGDYSEAGLLPFGGRRRRRGLPGTGPRVQEGEEGRARGRADGLPGSVLGIHLRRATMAVAALDDYGLCRAPHPLDER